LARGKKREVSCSHISSLVISLVQCDMVISIRFGVMFWFLHLIASSDVQVIFSMGDEYVPEYVDKRALLDR
jgi:tetrahydromethanopterin S-methyltransferase subunit C